MRTKKKYTFDELCKHLTSPTETSVAEKVTTIFQHRESKYSGQSIESENPNLYEIFHPQESVEFISSLIAVLENIIINDNRKIKKSMSFYILMLKKMSHIFLTWFLR